MFIYIPPCPYTYIPSSDRSQPPTRFHGLTIVSPIADSIIFSPRSHSTPSAMARSSAYAARAARSQLTPVTGQHKRSMGLEFGDELEALVFLEVRCGGGKRIAVKLSGAP